MPKGPWNPGDATLFPMGAHGRRVPRLAVRIAYDGTRFAGSQRQPDQRTVEGELLQGLQRIGAIAGAREAHFQCASRTDRGVSAAGNVVAFDTEFRRDALLPALGAVSDDVWPHALAEVPHAFEARHAKLRRYVYFLPEEPGLDHALLDAALHRFEGTHDFRSFARVEEGTSPIRTVTAARAAWEPGFVAIRVEGPSFLWNQVRRMVEAARRVACGEATLEALQRGLKGEAVDLGCAHPEGLVLWEVDHGLAWEPHATAMEAAATQLGARLAALEREAKVLATLRVGLGGSAALGAGGQPRS